MNSVERLSCRQADTQNSYKTIFGHKHRAPSINKGSKITHAICCEVESSALLVHRLARSSIPHQETDKFTAYLFQREGALVRNNSSDTHVKDKPFRAAKVTSCLSVIQGRKVSANHEENMKSFLVRTPKSVGLSDLSVQAAASQE